MNQLSLRDLAVPMIKSIDTFNYLLKSHHRRVAIISYFIGTEIETIVRRAQESSREEYHKNNS